jgi:Spy/CpxP family protein refolding chaperone
MHAAGWGPGKHAGAHGGEGVMALRLSPRMLDRLEATPQQREQIRAIMDAARTDLQAQHESGRALHQRSMALWGQADVDAAALEALRKEMLAQRDRASQRQLQAVLEASRVLTPEQRKRLAEHAGQRRDMKERHHLERRALEAPKS